MIDFNKLKTGVDSVDFWLEDLNDTYFYFKGPLTRDQLPTLSNYNKKTLRIAGEVFMNNVWRNQTLEITIFRAESDMMSNTTNGNQYSAYRANFNLSVQPKDFNIHKKPQRLTNTIFIGVGSGRINLATGMENLLGEAYTHE